MSSERYQDLLSGPLSAIASGEVPIKPPQERKPEPEEKTVILDSLGELGRETAISPETVILSPYRELCIDIAIMAWLGVWQSSLPGHHYDIPSLERALEEIQSELASTGVKPYLQESISAYQELAAPSSQESPRRPANSSLHTLFEGVDTITRSHFLEIYEKAPNANIRLYVESVLIAAKEIVRPRETLTPLISSRYLVPFVKKGGARFSAVIITEEAQAGKHWQEPEIAPGYSRLSAFDYYRQEAALHPYDVLEVKAILTEGPEKIEKMLRTEVGHFLRQLTWLTIWWDKNRKGDFPFPERLIIAHLRGSSPHLFYSMPLNPWFFEQWINALEERRQSLRKSIPEYESPLDLSKNQWPVAMRAKIETRETETFMDILIRGQKITAQKEQETKDKGGEVKQWKQWKLP